MIRSLHGARFIALAAALLTSVLTASRAEAQYFGRNKVQYDDFDFRVLRTSHFDLHYYTAEAAAARDGARMAERWYARLADVFGHEILTRQPLILYADHGDFQQSNVISGTLDESTGGVTEGLQRRVIMPFASSYGESDHVLGHELVHAFQYDIAEQSRGGLTAMSRIPLWMVEGMAEYLSVGRHDPVTAIWLRDAVLRDDVPTLRKLSSDYRYFPYRFGQAVWAYVGGRWGDRMVPHLYRAALDSNWQDATRRVLGIEHDSLSADWRSAVSDAFTPLIAGRTRPDSLGRGLHGAGEDIGEIMLGPALSPDGRYVAFLWARDLSLDLYLADARTGRDVRRLASGAAESKFDALSFMGSAGTWSPDGVSFAFVVFADGRNEIAILDVASGSVRDRYRVDAVGAIATPAWSPDGRNIAFSGSAGGVSDLYLLDLATRQTKKLTSDAFADLQPAWSPDGRTLAFATDRFGADPARLLHGRMQIATLDIASRDIRPVVIASPGRQTNAQFTPDGRELLFLDDGDGFRDLFRIRLETGQVSRVTTLATGITGFTALSPALSVARETGDVALSVFHRRGYVLRLLDGADALGQMHTTVAGALPRAPAGTLPPFDAHETVESYLTDSETGLADDATLADDPYRARPRLSYFGPPTFGIGVDQFGVGLYASAEAYFTDVLGDHGIAVQAIANGSWKDIGGALFYENAGNRVNWGVGLGRTPYVARYATARDTVATVNGTPRSALSIVEYRQRLHVDEGFLAARYPISATRRIEATGGVMRIGYDFEIARTVQVGNEVVSRETIPLATPDALTLFQTSAALVGDHSVFGIASPVQGGRYRFELQPTIGSLQFVSLTADWRTYLYRRPFTLAARVMHYGRYGRDADRTELGNLYVGSGTLVRGYSYESYTGADCSTGGSSGPTGCAELDRLIGSRLAVGNLELRVPLIGNERYGVLDIPFLPTELAAFVDGGVAWTGSESPTLSANGAAARTPVFSAGVSARFNLFNAFVLETYLARPFQRTTGNRWGVNLAVGW